MFKVKGQGHRVKFLGEGIRHALRCPCIYLFPKTFIWLFNHLIMSVSDEGYSRNVSCALIETFMFYLHSINTNMYNYVRHYLWI